MTDLDISVNTLNLIYLTYHRFNMSFQSQPIHFELILSNIISLSGKTVISHQNSAKLDLTTLPIY